MEKEVWVKFAGALDADGTSFASTDLVLVSLGGLVTWGVCLVTQGVAVGHGRSVTSCPFPQPTCLGAAWRGAHGAAGRGTLS